MQQTNGEKGSGSIRCLVIVCSYHHNNTAKIANQFAEVLNARVAAPGEVNPGELQDYELIGFGSGIDSGKHYQPLLELAGRLPEVRQKPCFIFSTSGIQGEEKVEKDHALLRQTLQSKGYLIVGEFSCKGYNTNSFLKYFGGMNKGRPDSADLRDAAEFALRLAEKMNAGNS